MAEFSWRDPLQVTRVWGQYMQVPAPQWPPVPAAVPKDPYREVARQNLAPPPVTQ